MLIKELVNLAGADLPTWRRIIVLPNRLKQMLYP